MADLKNPFDIVKATDLSDRQIADYFVDFPGGASLLGRIKPTSRMPMFIFGGKGSGKTHLMRYLSYPLQRSRFSSGEAAITGIAEEGYLGIYFRCGGLNAQRFSGKGQPEDVWRDMFAYYMELWLGQLVLTTISDLYSDLPRIRSVQLINDATRLLDIMPSPTPATFEELSKHLETLQRQADVAINNCALTRRLDVQIQATAGRLLFGLPEITARHLPELRSTLFLYLIDEFENLTRPQQRYINTLVRERKDPCSFKVGVRLYGFRTKQTFSADEENREDSEYEVLRLDSELRERPDTSQQNFARDLVHKRLLQAGYLLGTTPEHMDISAWFEVGDQDFSRTDIEVSKGEPQDSEPSYIISLRRKLRQGLRSGASNGVRSDSDIERVISTLRFPQNPLIERTSIFLMYREWASGANLLKAAEAISQSACRYARSPTRTNHQKVLKYFRSDIVAQLLRETKQKQRYLGFETFVKMSAGLPRGLLTILKYVFTWSLFYGEQPFREGRISARAQSEGIGQASEWFFTEARAPGVTGAQVRDAMTRLGQLLREVRFSDKPSECSLSTFSADLTTATENAIEVLEAAANWSMLLRVAGGQHDRNDGRVDEKYQVHPMLAPRWDLPIARRGALGLSGEELTAVFAPSNPFDFDVVLKRRVAAMTAPSFGQESYAAAPLLPGLGDADG